MQRMNLEFGFPEPVPQFGDLRAVVIVQMLARAKKFYQRDAGLPNPVQQNVAETLVDQKVGRKGTLHEGRVLVSRSLAAPARIGRSLQPAAVVEDRVDT